jgi:hypothetical protein
VVSEELIGAITSTIAEHVETTGVMVTNFVLLAAFVDEHGTGSIYTETAQDQRCHETLGLLTFGLALENRRAAEGGDE